MRTIPFLIVVLAACGRPMDIGLQERVLEGTWSGEGQIVASKDGARWHWSKTTDGGGLECWDAWLPALILSRSNTFEIETDIHGAFITVSPFPEVLSGKGPARLSGRLEDDTLRLLVERTDMVMTIGPDDMIMVPGQPERERCQRP